jgi:hypothetical protein
MKLNLEVCEKDERRYKIVNSLRGGKISGCWILLRWICTKECFFEDEDEWLVDPHESGPDE